jgi:hypothetical protein
LSTQEQYVGERGERGCEEAVEIRSGEIRRAAEKWPQHGTGRHHQDGSDQERAVDLERAPDETRTRGRFGTAREHRSIGRRRGETAEKHEDFGRVVECECMERDPRKHAPADVIDENHQKHKAAKKVEFDEARRFFLHVRLKRG